MSNGDVVLLENSCFQLGERSNDVDFARKLSENADVFVNDAFCSSNRYWVQFRAVYLSAI